MFAVISLNGNTVVGQRKSEGKIFDLYQVDGENITFTVSTGEQRGNKDGTVWIRSKYPTREAAEKAAQDQISVDKTLSEHKYIKAWKVAILETLARLSLENSTSRVTVVSAFSYQFDLLGYPLAVSGQERLMGDWSITLIHCSDRYEFTIPAEQFTTYEAAALEAVKQYGKVNYPKLADKISTLGWGGLKPE